MVNANFIVSILLGFVVTSTTDLGMLLVPAKRPLSLCVRLAFAAISVGTLQNYVYALAMENNCERTQGTGSPTVANLIFSKAVSGTTALFMYAFLRTSLAKVLSPDQPAVIFDSKLCVVDKRGDTGTTKILAEARE